MSPWKAVVALPLAVAGLAATGAAQARTDVQWSITIGSPVVVHPAPVYHPPVVHVPPPVYVEPRPIVVRPAPIYYRPYPAVRYRPAPVYRPYRWDADRDGIPDRQDRRYDPYGDRDRDGVPNRHDRDDRNPYRR